MISHNTTAVSRLKRDGEMIWNKELVPGSKIKNDLFAFSFLCLQGRLPS